MLGAILLTPTRGVCVCVKLVGGSWSPGSGDPAWRSHYGFDFVHVLIVADVGVSLWGLRRM